MRISGKKNRALSVAIAMQVMFGAGTVMAADTTTGDNEGTICTSTSEGGNTTCGGGVNNTASNYSSAVVGGNSGNASGAHSTVIGGGSNTAKGDFSSTVGGLENTASGTGSVALGGNSNVASGVGSAVIGGGESISAEDVEKDKAAEGNIFKPNIASGNYSLVAGGTNNTASGQNSAVIGGIGNTASNDDSIATGAFNAAKGRMSAAIGGDGNTISEEASQSGIIAGTFNNILGASSENIVAGGDNNTIKDSTQESSILGGVGNRISKSRSSVILGGSWAEIQKGDTSALIACENSGITHDKSAFYFPEYRSSRIWGQMINKDNYIKEGYSQFDVVLGGDYNLITGHTFGSAILGGANNYVNGAHSAIVGGYSNSVAGTNDMVYYAASIGGSGNAATKDYAATYGGAYNLASGIASAAIGGGDYNKGNTASGDYSLAAGGVGNTASGKYSVSIGGTEGTASGESSVSIAGGKATTDKSIAIGAGSNASANNSIAIGADSTADEDNTMSVGNASSQRRITHVAEGINGTDAVNVDQLKKAISDVTVVPGGSGDGHDKNAVHYDGDKHDIVTLDGGSNGTTITNLKAGKVTNTSTDAINGSQLYTEQESRKDGDESLSKRIGYIDNSKTYNNISSKNNVTQNLEALDKAIIVKDDGKSVTIAKDSSTKVIDVKGTNNEQRIITGVKTDGSDKSSAVNVGFLDDRIDGLHADMNKIGAGAAALAGLHPLQYDKKNPLSVSAAVGTYDGEAAVAIGAFYQKSKNLLFSVGGSVSDKVMMNVGVSGRFGKEAPDDDNKDIRDIIREEVKAQIKSMMATPEKKDEPKWNESHFVDVPENHWAKPAVDKLAKYGAIIGYGDETFRGENAATRYEVAQMVVNAMGVQDKKHAADDFTDKTIDEK